MARGNFIQQVRNVQAQIRGPIRAEMMVAAANEAFNQAMLQNKSVLGKAPPFKQFVDGALGAPLSSVRPGGIILFTFDVGGAILEEAVEATASLLAHMSPVRSGLYSRSHRVLVNGAEFSKGSSGGAAGLKLEQDDEVSFVNLLPYARKIEQGLSDQAPNGIYESAYTVLRSRYGNQLKMNFTYESYPGQEVGGRKGGGFNESASDFRRAASFPTITMSVR